MPRSQVAFRQLQSISFTPTCANSWRSSDF